MANTPHQDIDIADRIDQFTAVVTLHHDLDAEVSTLLAALASPAYYIGALGSTPTHRPRSEELLQMGISAIRISVWNRALERHAHVELKPEVLRPPWQPLTETAVPVSDICQGGQPHTHRTFAFRGHRNPERRSARRGAGGGSQSSPL